MPDSASKLQKQFGGFLRSERKAHDLTQEQLALDVGLSLTYVGELERGEKMPSLETIQRLAKTLGFSAGELLIKAKI